MKIELYFTCTPYDIDGDPEEQYPGTPTCGNDWFATVELTPTANPELLYGFAVCPSCKEEHEIEIKATPTHRDRLVVMTA